MNFYAASKDYCTIEKHVCAPLFKRVFDYPGAQGTLRIAATGFYRLFLNGEELTKGFLAPYISNPDQVVYYDEYDVSSLLRTKDNVLCVLLGNGFVNSKDFGCWDFEKAPFRAAPSFALELFDKEKFFLSTDAHFRVTDSPITFDDLRCGERYDARLERENVLTDTNTDGFRFPLPVSSPKGELCLCTADPIACCDRLQPASVSKSGKGYLYSFAENNSGVCKLTINGTEGQRIDLFYAELIQNGSISIDNLGFWNKPPAEYIQHDVYICKDGYQTYLPSFTYHGFQYVYVEGITEEQATKDLLEYVVFHSDIHPRGSFRCSCDVLNRLVELTKRSDVSNFHYFPTDCPHREKNGWTGDALLSAEQTMLLFDASASYREWLHCIVKAQKENGQFPGIVPTAGWGYDWGSGPAYDSIIVGLPYQLYRFCGDLETVKACKSSIRRYFDYYRTKINEDGLVAYGLPDWLEIGSHSDSNCSTPLELTDSLLCMDLWRKAAELSRLLHDEETASLYDAEADRLLAAFRHKYIAEGHLTVRTQAACAMALSLCVFAENEKQGAENDLLASIQAAREHLKIGLFGIPHLYRVLTDMGKGDLVYQLITRPDYPSFASMLHENTTTLWESFDDLPEDIRQAFLAHGRVYSYNHHCWGSVSAWIIKTVGGLNVLGKREIEIAPQFPQDITFAETIYENDGCRIRIRIDRTQDDIRVTADNSGFSGHIIVGSKKMVLNEGNNAL